MHKTLRCLIAALLFGCGATPKSDRGMTSGGGAGSGPLLPNCDAPMGTKVGDACMSKDLSQCGGGQLSIGLPGGINNTPNGAMYGSCYVNVAPPATPGGKGSWECLGFVTTSGSCNCTIQCL